MIMCPPVEDTGVMILSAWSVSGSTRYWVGPACTRAEVARAKTRTREDSMVRVVQLVVMVLQLVMVQQLVMTQLVMVQLVVHWCHLHTAARWCGLVFTTNQSCTTTTHPLLPRPE